MTMPRCSRIRTLLCLTVLGLAALSCCVRDVSAQTTGLSANSGLPLDQGEGGRRALLKAAAVRGQQPYDVLPAAEKKCTAEFQKIYKTAVDPQSSFYKLCIQALTDVNLGQANQALAMSNLVESYELAEENRLIKEAMIKDGYMQI